MEKLIKFIQERPVVVVTALGVATYCTAKGLKVASDKLFGGALARLDTTPDHYENGIIYLHMFPRTSPQHMNISPYAVKLESWLRLNKIPYKVVETFKFSSQTGQIPYIRLDGEEVADSSKIIHFIEEKYNIKDDLSEEQQAMAHCIMRTVDDSLVWTYAAQRYMHNDQFYTKYLQLPASRFVNYLALTEMKNHVSKRLIAHGIGRKSIADVEQIARDDILAISHCLGKKKFIMGDSISKVDCAVFAHLSQMVYVDFAYPQKEFIKDECPNIMPYMERVKRGIWPDWDKLVTP